MADFDPDAYLSAKASGYSGQNPPVQPTSVDPIQLQQFDPDAYLAAKGNESYTGLQSKYGTLPQQAITAAEGASKGLVSAPVTALAEKGLTKLGVPGLSPEEQVLREEANPKISAGSEALGFAGPAIATGGLSALGKAGVSGAAKAAGAIGALSKFSQAGLLEKAGAALAPAAVSTVGKIGSKAVQMAVENGLYSSGDEAAKFINQDPNQTVGSAIAHIGLGAAIGGALGGGGASLAPIWQNTAGKATSGLLGTIAKRMGGVDGLVSEPVEEAITNSGIDLAPEIKANMAKDPHVVEMARTLNQSDTTGSGLKFQESMNHFHEQAGDAVSSALGKDPGKIPEDFSKYEAGKKIGETLSDEFSEKVNPLVDRYDAYGKMFAGKELGQETVPILQENIAQLAQEQGWTASKSSDIMREVNRVISELPDQKTLRNLGDFIKQVGENTKSTLPFGQQTPVSRAGAMIKNLLREAEGDAIGSHLGAEEGPLAKAGYEGLRKDYAQAAQLKDALNDRLKTGGSTAGYAKGLQEMARTDGERIYQRLNGKSDADLIKFMQDNFPRTAEAMKSQQLNELLSKSVKREEGKATLDATKAIGSLNKLSPEQKAFLVPQEGADKLKGVQTLLDTLKNPKHNFSNTSRVADKLLEHVPSSALALVTMLMGHGVGTGLLVGKLGEFLSKSAPDAIRLSLLKWLGSGGKSINAPAFKAMTDFFHSAIKGDHLGTNAVKAVFNGASKVLPDHILSNDRDLDALDKKVQDIQMNPGSTMDSGSMTAYYLPEHGASITSAVGNVASYLASVKPVNQKKSPLDPEPVLSRDQKNSYNQALRIAQQPLTVMNLLGQGKLSSTDMKHFVSMYPDLHNDLAKKISDYMAEHISKGKTVPYQIKQGLSLFLNQPLDSGLSPSSIQSNQQTFSVNAQQQAAKNAPKPSVVGMREMKMSNRLSLSTPDNEV